MGEQFSDYKMKQVHYILNTFLKINQNNQIIQKQRCNENHRYQTLIPTFLKILN